MKFYFRSTHSKSENDCMKFSEDSNLKKFFEERFSSFERFIDPDKKEITGKFYAGEKITVKVTSVTDITLICFNWLFEGTKENGKKIFGIGFYAVKIKKNKPLKKSMFSRIPKSEITSEKY